MRVVVCGSRDYADYETVRLVLMGVSRSYFMHNLTIVDGACPYGGADQLAHEAALAFRWPTKRYPAENREGWNRPTSYEFLKRNRAMIDDGADLCIAFVNKPLEQSRGTAYTVNYARTHGVKTIVVQT